MSKKIMTALTILLALVPVTALVLLYSRLPDRVPIHWGIDGTVGYGDRSTLWMTALLPPCLLLLFKLLPNIDPRKQNYAKFQGYYDAFCLVMMLFLLGLNALTLSESLRPGHLSVSTLVIVGVGVLLVFLGNLMPKVKNNFFMGVRTPWTLSDPDVWNRTNRLGGQCLFGFGLVMIVSGLLLPDGITLILLLAGVAVMVALPMVMSYLWFRRQGKSPVDKDSEP